MTADGMLREGLKTINPQGFPQAVENLLHFSNLLLDRNRVMNLTGAKSIEEIVSRHLLDCITAMSYLELDGKQIIDVGCGAGFPGMPLAILWPEAQITLLDSLGKRITFLKQCIEILKIKNAEAVHARAEEYHKREQYDIAVSRAVANLRVLSELCLPLVKIGGIFAAMKSTACDDEISESKQAVHILGGTIEDIKDYQIPGTEIYQRVIFIRKREETPGKYPRRYAKITTQPL